MWEAVYNALEMRRMCLNRDGETRCMGAGILGTGHGLTQLRKSSLEKISSGC